MWWWLAACVPGTTTAPEPSGTSPGGDTTCLGHVEDLALDDPGPGGFTAREAIAPFATTFIDVIEYRDGTEAELHVTVTPIAARVQNPGGVGTYYAYTALTCTLPEHFDADVEIILWTDDGAFDEVYTATVGIDELPTTLSVLGTVAADALGGTYTSAEMDSLSASTLFRDDGTSAGELVEIRYYDGGAVTECGIGAWGGPLMTDCP